MNLRAYASIARSLLHSKLKRMALGPHSIGVLNDTQNGLLIASAYDTTVGRKLAFDGKYDVEALDSLRTLVTPDSSVCFIGCHVGSLLVPIARIAKSVVGYEANPATFRLLEMNVKINNLRNIRLFNRAVGDKAGKIEFVASRLNPGGSKIKPKKDRFIYRYDHPDHIVVEMVSLDEHCAEQFDVIVMDIEGAEFMALKGMPNALRRCRHLKLEFVPHHLENVSGVSNEEFLGVVSPYFTSMKEEGPGGKTYKGQDMLALLDSLRSRERSAELIFSK